MSLIAKKTLVDPKFGLLLFGGQSVLLASLFCYANWNGLGLTHDSYYYLESAATFRQTLSFDNLGINQYFPFQSFLIMMLSILGQYGYEYSFYINGCLLIATNGLFLWITLSLIKSRFIIICFTFTMTFSVSQLMVHSHLWTEPLFLFFLAIMWLLTIRFYNKPNLKNLIWLVIISVLVCLQRKAGMLFIASTSLGLFLVLVQNRFTYLKVTVVALFVLVLILLFGYLGGPNIIGEKPSFVFFLDQLHYYLDTTSAWILPLPIPYYLRLITLLLIVLGSMVYYLKKKNSIPNNHIIAIFTFVFFTYFIIRLFYDRPDPSEMERYLSPVYPIFLLVMYLIMEHLLFKISDRRKLIMQLVLLIWMIYPLIRVAKNAHLWHLRESNNKQAELPKI